MLIDFIGLGYFLGEECHHFSNQFNFLKAPKNICNHLLKRIYRHI
jgi:hypothetical protein